MISTAHGRLPVFLFRVDHHPSFQLDMNSSRSFSCSSQAALPLTPSNSRFVCNGLPRPSSSSYHSTLELEEEIASLEIEILRLERYLLSLYRTAPVEQLPTSPPPPTTTPLKRSQYKIKSSSFPVAGVKQLHELGYNEPSHAKELSISSSSSTSSIFSKETPAEEKTSYSSRHRSLADHLGAAPVEDTICAPDRLSQEILRCISCVYCKLADAPLGHGHSAFSEHSPTPSAYFSTKSSFKSKTPYDNCWSPCKEELVAINQLKGRRGASELHADTIEILGIRAEGRDSVSYATKMLRSLRSMVQKLEMIDPRSMRREEKLAFWINIHNALVMHAYLAHGTQNRANSRTVLKASYNIGGHRVDAYMIQSSILGIRPHVSALRLRALFSSGKKTKRSASTKHEYALEYPEPLVHFALCSGAYSDPVVRAYRGKDIFHQLQIGKEEYIRENARIKKDKVILPKTLWYFAKDASLDASEVLGMVSKCLPEEAKKDFVNKRSDKSIHWSAPCSTFRFVIHGGLP